ncbi:unnamed protein product [Linum trigynum]|uniref:Uncharacterized protein n=1 Tax=Linum trigynum TaxID=586398 RepID=A0AAV2ETH1_9ROSI
MSEALSGATPPAPQPPDSSTEQRPPQLASSSPTGKGDRETQHTKKNARLMCANPLFVVDEMVEDPEMIETEPTVEEPVKPASLPQTEIPPLAWGAGAGAKNFFSDVIAESNSKDVAEAMKIENLDDEVSEDEDPRRPTILLTSMEKQRYRC